MYWKICVQLHPMNLVDMPVNYNDNLHDLSVFQDVVLLLLLNTRQAFSSYCNWD